MPSRDRGTRSTDAHQEPSLRRFAVDCIEHGIEHGAILDIDPAQAPTAWREPGACFVTLRLDGELRGCTGTFDASQPIVANVASSAYRTAFRDPRFSPVTRDELERLDVEISLLGPPRSLPAVSRADLLTRLTPGADGLIVSEGVRRATFLPAVWESLPEPSDFVDALFRKAGLPMRHWSPDLRFQRYSATKAP